MKLRVTLPVPLLSAMLAAGSFWSYSACAALGEQESSLKGEAELSRASIKASDRGAYRVHEIELPTGTLVREYASLDGNIFAVTWHGPFVPNLKQTLGRYFDEFVAGAKAVHGDHHHVQLRQSDLVVQSGGHMRAVSGRAYLPQAIPNGVSVGDLE